MNSSTRTENALPDADAGVVVGYPESYAGPTPLVLGAGARLRTGTVLYHGSRIGVGLETGHGVVVRETCEIGDQVCIWSNTVVDYGCRIGDRVKIHANCYIAQYTEIDEDAFLAPGVTIANDLYPGSDESARMMSGPHIEAGAQIGVNVTILPYVRIGAGTIVGSGAVVTRDLPPRVVAYGNPARPHRDVGDLPSIGDRIVDSTGGARRFRLKD